jgi:tetratricopeptide (TPR) repeat protein
MTSQNISGAIAISFLIINADMVHSEPQGATTRIPDRSNWSSTRSNENHLSRLAAEANDALLRGNDAVAIARCTSALSMNPDKKITSFLYYLRSEAYRDTNRAQAMKDAESAIHADASAQFGYLARGYLNSYWGKHSLAIADLSRAIRIAPNDSTAYLHRGVSYVATGNIEQAFADFSEAIRREPRDAKKADAYFNRAQLYLGKQDYKRALSDLQVALRRSNNQGPKYQSDSLNGIAWIKATCPDAVFRDGNKAVELSKKACELSNWRSPECIDTLAAAYAECEDFDQAVKYGTQAAKISDPDPTTPPRQKAFFDEQRRQHLRSYKKHEPVRDDGKLPPF